jgi:pyridoxal phosphate enzyme (YggS family)
MKKILKKIDKIKKKIKSLSKKHKINAQKIKLLIVTKNKKNDIINKLIKNNFFSFGENYLQESLKKIKKFQKNKIKWHFIGKIQSNKTKLIAENFSWCHSIDREKIAFLLNKNRKNKKSPLKVLIQIKINDNKKKNGISIKSLFHLSKYIKSLPNLELRGIMALPNIIQNNDKQKINEYQEIQKIFKKMQKKYKKIDTLSLGTSQDFKKAILYGSTLIRIGRKIFS